MSSAEVVDLKEDYQARKITQFHRLSVIAGAHGQVRCRLSLYELAGCPARGLVT